VLVLKRLTEIDPTVKAGSINLPTSEAFYRRGMLAPLEEQQRLGFERMAAFMRPKKCRRRGGAGDAQDRRAFRRDHGRR
jgi:hypothetical protein